MLWNIGEKASKLIVADLTPRGNRWFNRFVIASFAGFVISIIWLINIRVDSVASQAVLEAAPVREAQHTAAVVKDMQPKVEKALIGPTTNAAKEIRRLTTSVDALNTKLGVLYEARGRQIDLLRADVRANQRMIESLRRKVAP